MSLRSRMRFEDGDPEREQARLDDVLERTVHGLTEQLSPAQLESVLASLGASSVALQDQPPLSAAVLFRDAALVHARSTGLNASALATAVHDVVSDGRAPSELTPQFDRAIFVFGIRRGGNHAISEWLHGHFDYDEITYVNSAEISAFCLNGGGTLSVDKDTYDAVPLEAGKKVLIVGYENLDPAHFPFSHNAAIAHRSDVVVVLRDFPNTAASIVRQARDEPSFAYRYRIRDLLDLWSRYAAYFEQGAFGYRYVSFNAWFNDVRSRRAISAALGLEHSDRRLNSVSQYGLGSSFDGPDHDGQGQQMAVLGRWASLMDDALFQFVLLADEEALERNARLFGTFPHGREQLLERWRNATGR